MEETSRTKNSIKNIKTGFIVQLINKLLAFVVRTVFIKVLNEQYLGVNGLFTNILTILSFAELGIGTAIIYNMYKPVADQDYEKLKSLMSLYKRAYNIIGIVVFLAGLLVIPFMDILITDVPDIKENIIIIYLMFLADTSISYFLTYKKSIIIANQKQNVINNIDSVFYIIKSVFQILILIVTKNYYVYLITQIFSTLIENLILYKVAEKMYPFLKDKKIQKLKKSEQKNIFSNVKSLAIYQIGTVVMNGTDNILISAMLNVTAVGLVSNYTLIINSVKSIITNALNGVTASVGNLNVVGTTQKKESIFYQMTLIYYLIYSFCTIGFILIISPFVEIWLGSKYILGSATVIALSISFFIDGLRQPGYIYRTTCGMFEKSKLTPYIAAITNIILSIVLCKMVGLVGIFIATCIATLISYSWIDPFLLHKYEFKSKFSKYLKKYGIYVFIFSIELILCIFLSKLLNLGTIANLLYNIALVLIVPNILNIMIFSRTQEFKALINRLKFQRKPTNS